MIFVDTNVFMYAVGREHPLKEASRQFFRPYFESHQQLCTSTEVLQELLHIYVHTRRILTFQKCMRIVRQLNVRVWPLEYEDVALAGELSQTHPALSSRDLCHLASCRRRGIRTIKTLDRTLASAFA